MIFLRVLLCLFPGIANAKLNVVTTTTDLASLVRQVGGERVEVFSISKGTQVFKNSAVRTVHVEIQVVEGTVNVRSCPSTTCRVVGYLYANQKIEVLGCLGNWCEVIVEEEIFYVYAPCVGQGTGVCK